ncbi:hypothetical protein [Chitinimonas sp.]|uniref:hypothetical protein n=1 Tax=Chitinimonas sp. TaxID=1934313 RepID=UPI002F947426
MLVKVYQSESGKIFLPKEAELLQLPAEVQAIAGANPSVRNTVLEEDTGIMGVDVSRALADIESMGYHLVLAKP